MDFQLVLKELRQEKALSQLNLAEIIGVARGTVSHWEVGRIEPNIAMLKKLADIFEVSIDYLCGRTERPDLNEPYVHPAPAKEDSSLLKYIKTLDKTNKYLLHGFVKLLIETQEKQKDAQHIK